MATIAGKVDRSPRFQYLLSVGAEHLCLAVAMAFLIPPVPSIDGERYYFGRSAPLMLLFLILSRYIAIRRGQESWVGLMLKAILFTVVGFLIFETAYT